MYFDAAKFGKRVRSLREMRGLTQEQFADEMSITYTHSNRIENGTRVPSLDLMIEMAEFFGVLLDFLIMGRQFLQMSNKDALYVLAKTIEDISQSL